MLCKEQTNSFRQYVSGLIFRNKVGNEHHMATGRNVVLTKKVWERSQKITILKELQTDFEA